MNFANFKTVRYKTYKTELINGSSGTISIPESESLQEMIEASKFIKDNFTGESIRSSAIVKYKHIGYDETISDGEDMFFLKREHI